jgi:predicted peptidase
VHHLLPTQAGLYEVTVQPGDRRVALAVPAVVERAGRQDAGIPLIIALHYGGPMYPFKGGKMLRAIVEPALGSLQALVAAPDCNHGHWANEPSETEVLALVDRLQVTYEIDRDKTLLTGISRGGVGAWYIGGRNQEKFTAVMPIAAEVPLVASGRRWHIPLLVIHSRADERFPLVQVESAVARLRDGGSEVETMFLEGIGHYDVDRLVEPLAAAVPWIKQVWNQGREEVKELS